MTFSKKIHFLKKKKQKKQTFIRSRKLFCKFQDFFKSPRPYTNPGWLCDVTLFHSCLKILPQEWPKVSYELFTIYMGKPESNLRFEKSVPCSHQKMAAKAWNWYQRWLEEIGAQISIWNILYEKTGLPSQMFQCSRKFSTKKKSCTPLGSKWILLNFCKW